MFTLKHRRKIKKIFGVKEEKLSDFLYRTSFIFVIIFFAIFLLTQLYLNSILTPKGAKLEALNNEKTVLIETNRNISQEIARIKSISIIKEVTDREMNLRPLAEGQVLYISNESVLAEL